MHYNINVNPELYPLKLALYTTPSELNLAFLTTTQEDLVDAELNDITYTIAAKYAKNAHKAKLQEQSKANVPILSSWMCAKWIFGNYIRPPIHTDNMDQDCVTDPLTILSGILSDCTKTLNSLACPCLRVYCESRTQNPKP